MLLFSTYLIAISTAKEKKKKRKIENNLKAQRLNRGAMKYGIILFSLHSWRSYYYHMLLQVLVLLMIICFDDKIDE